MQPFSFFPDTRAKYRPGVGGLNISMDFNAAPSGTARGTEVIIPNNASPELRAAAARYNQGVAAFAAKHGISDYPIRGVRTRAENGRGVPNTVHTEPFFNSDVAMQEAIKANPKEFAAIYSAAFQGIPGARAIAPHGIGKDRGAASSIFGDETSFGQFIAKAAAGEDLNGLLDIAAASTGQAPITGGQSQPVAVGGPQQDTLETKPMQQQRSGLFNMTDEQRDRLVLAMSGMSLNPNQGLMAMAQHNMQSRAKEADRTRAAQAQQQQANRTAEWLAQQPGGQQLAQGVATGAISGGDALTLWQKAQKGPEQTSLQKQYAQAVQQGYQGSLMDYQIELKKAGASKTTINTGDKGPAPDATVRDELQKNHADVLSGFLGAGAKAGSALNDLQVLKELASVAPTGPLQGRLAQAFPEFSDVSALRQAIVKRVAPTLRVEGSGSTSDIEYQGMIDGLGRLTNTPEANIAIADMMLAKANLDIQRGNVVQQYQNGQITYEQMNTQLAEMNKVSIMPESVRAMLSGGAATQPQAQPVQLPQVPNFTEMSDADLDAYIEKMGGQ